MEGSELRLGDDGVCFDPKTMRANSSLGLISMGERVRFVNGQLSVESQACEGTRIKVCVPIAGVDEFLKHSAPRSGRFRQTAQRGHRTKVPYTTYADGLNWTILPPPRLPYAVPVPGMKRNLFNGSLLLLTIPTVLFGGLVPTHATDESPGPAQASYSCPRSRALPVATAQCWRMAII